MADNTEVTALDDVLQHPPPIDLDHIDMQDNKEDISIEFVQAGTPLKKHNNAKIYDDSQAELLNKNCKKIGFITPSFTDIQSSFVPYHRNPGTKYNIVFEAIKLFIGVLILLPLRILFMMLTIALLFVVSKLALLGLSTNPKEQHLIRLSMWRIMLIKLLQPLIRLGLFIIGVAWVKESKLSWNELPYVPPSQSSHNGGPCVSPYPKPMVIVANHLGYIDIMILAAKYGGAFVSKEAISNVFVIGTIARAMQTLFLSRNKSLTEVLISRVQTSYECLSSHKRNEACAACCSKLVIFPEGTTTNGDGMVKFRTGIFLAGRPVLPVAIKLPFKRFSLSWETIRFRDHLFYTMTQFVNYAELIELPLYVPNEEEKEDAHLFSKNVQDVFSAVLKQPSYVLNRKHKFLYHDYLLKKKSAEDVLELSKKQLETDMTLARVVQQ